MKFALINDLEQSAFLPGTRGVGTASQCVKIFDTEQAATAYAAGLLRDYVCPKWINEVDHSHDWRNESDESVLETFQDNTGGLEWFHIFPIVLD